MLEFGRSQLTLGSDSGSEPVVAKYHGGLNIGKSSTSYYVGAETDCEREVNLLSRLLNALVLLGVLLPLLVDTVQGKCPELPPPGGCIGDLDYASFTVLLIAVSAIMAIGYGCYRLVARLRKRG